jgi:hypothetical protein
MHPPGRGLTAARGAVSSTATPPDDGEQGRGPWAIEYLCDYGTGDAMVVDRRRRLTCAWCMQGALLPLLT